MTKTINRQAEVAAEHFLGELDDSADGNTRTVNYQILTRPFKSTRFVAKLANRIFHIPLFVLKKGMSDYLGKQSMTDSTLLSDTSRISEKISKLETEHPKLLEEKTYEMMKLVDRLKSELMAEINKDSSPLGGAEEIKPKWLKDKRQSLKKLNLGSGSHIMDGYINIDHREIEGVDLVADIRKLPLKNGSIDEIYLAHVVEHFTEYEMKTMLRHWYDLLGKGGIIKIVVPDIESMVLGFSRGDISWERLRLVILGGQDYNSDYHFNVFSEAYLTSLIKAVLPEAKVSTIAASRKNGEALELDIEIEK